MDTFTHGIAGALLGKAFFGGRDPRPSVSSEKIVLNGDRREKRQAARVAVFAATLGSIFPDSDIILGLFVRSRFAMLELHRGVTHSFVCLPVFALLLAAATRWVCRRKRIAAPGLGQLSLIYGIGIALHIVLDLITSWGTMIWSPISNRRAAWDLTSIIDFTFTAIVLLPQVAAWVYRRREGSLKRALATWALFSLAAVGVQRLAAAVGYPFSPWVTVVAGGTLAVLLVLPSWRGWGIRVPRQVWCRAGVAVLGLYLGAQAVAHQAALREVRAFARSQGVMADKIGALPMPPSLLYWNGLIRTNDGVYYSRLDLADGQLPQFNFFSDSPANGYVEAARKLPVVQMYLWFARFPVIGYAQKGEVHTVQFGDLRFFPRRSRREPFSLRVFLDDGGHVIGYRWIED